MVKLGMIHSEAVTLLFSAKEAIYKVFARFVANGLNFGSETLFVIDKVCVVTTSRITNSQYHK